jgi:tetratricopeptide (TPR) repeat protein
MRVDSFGRFWAAAMLLAACGGGGGPGKGQATTAGSPAGGPREQTVSTTSPTPIGEAPAPVPEVPRDAAWDGALNAYDEQERAGWSGGRCDDVAEKFVSAGKGKRADAFFNAGAVYLKCNKADDAERHFRKALEVDPNHAPSIGGLGEIALRAGKRDEAERLFRQAVAKDVRLEVTAAYVNLAWMQYQQMLRTQVPATRQQLETEALGNLQRSLAIDNDNVAAYTVMALIFMEGADRNRNRLDVAELLISEGKKRNDRYGPLWNASGILKIRRGNVAKALEDFRQAVTLDGRLAEARMNVGQIVLSSRNYNEAESQFREVLKLQPKSYEATIGLGVALRGQATVARAGGKTAEFESKINEAEETYKKAAGLDGNRPDAYYNLGLLYKDYRTNSEDQNRNIAQYRQAKKYFQDYLARADKGDEKRGEAQGHIQDCDKYVDILQKAMASK